MIEMWKRDLKLCQEHLWPEGWGIRRCKEARVCSALSGLFIFHCDLILGFGAVAKVVMR